jgi:cytochrome P450
MMDYIARVSLDIIGLAGFDYSFNSLTHGSTELSDGFATITRLAKEARFSADQAIVLALKGMIPMLRPINLDQKSKEMKRALDNMARVSNGLVEAQKKQLGLNEKTGEDKKSIFSLLLHANTNLENNGRSLSDIELAHQIPAFLMAGKFSLYLLMTKSVGGSLLLTPRSQQDMRQQLMQLYGHWLL